MSKIENACIIYSFEISPYKVNRILARELSQLKRILMETGFISRPILLKLMAKEYTWFHITLTGTCFIFNFDLVAG